MHKEPSTFLHVLIAVVVLSGFTASCKQMNSAEDLIMMGISSHGESINNPPQFVTVPEEAAVIDEDTPYTFIPEVTDPDYGDDVTYEIIGTLPDWLTFNPATGELGGTPPDDEASAGNFGPFTIIATDESGAQDSTGDFTITVISVDDDPIITGTPPASSSNNPYAWTPSVTDPDFPSDTNPVSDCSAVGLPAWASINPATCEITGNSPVSGDTEITITVTDSNGGTSTHTVTISIVSNNAPVVTLVATMTDEDTEKVITLPYTDSDTGDIAESCSVTGIVNGSVSTACSCSSGVCSVGLTPDSDSISDVTANFTVNDGDTDSNSSTITLSVTPVNDAPVISGIPATGSISTPYSFIPDVSDPDSGDTKTFSYTGTLPPGLSFNTATGEIFGTPTANGMYSGITIRVTDGSGAYDEITVSITVTTVNQAPTFSNNGITIDEGSSGNVISNAHLTGADAEDADSSITFTVITVPTNGVILTIDGVTAIVGSTFTEADIDAGKIALSQDGTEATSSGFTFSLEDSIGDFATGASDVSTATFSITITGQNDAPIISTSNTPGDATEDSSYSWTPTATDPESDTLTYGIAGGSTLPEGLSINTSTGEVSGTPTIPGTYNVEIEVNDGNGGVSTQSFSFTVINVIEIISAETQDLDNDGYIDHYKITFDGNVDDSTFPGYSSGSAGTTQTDWLVNGYSGVVFDDSLGDTTDNTVIYLAFTEGATPDTGAKPNLTTSATPGLDDTDGGSLAQVGDLDVTEADRAKPVLMTAEGTEGGTTLSVTFSEAVYGDANTPACDGSSGGDLVGADFGYTGGVTGATAISSIGGDACGNDAAYTVTLTMNNSMTVDDVTDVVIPSATSIYDAANNEAQGSASPTIAINDAPTIVSVAQTGDNTLEIVYSETMDEAATKATGNYKLVASKTISGLCSDNTNFSGNSADISVSSITGSGTTYTLTFASNFAADTWYTLVADRANATDSYVKDSIGKELACENTETFFKDSTGPFIVNASGEACGSTTEIYIETSEEVGNLVESDTMDTNGDTDQLQLSLEDDATGCTVPLPSSTITSSKNYGSPKELTVSANSALCTRFYQLRMKNPKDDGTYCGGAPCIEDQAGNTASEPAAYTFLVNDQLRVQNAQAVENSVTNNKYKIDLVFNKPVKQLSVECSTSTVCNKLYYVSGISNITNAELIGSRKVRLTTDTEQTGRFYTVVVNNGTTESNPASWTAEDTANPILSDSTCSTGETVADYPYDRFAFQGSGNSVDDLDSFFFDDPFQDGAQFAFAFPYKEQVYVGPNDINNAVFRFEPSGFNQSLANYEFINGTCTTPNGFGHVLPGNSPTDTTTGDLQCGGTLDNSGPFDEVGVVGFNAVTIDPDGSTTDGDSLSSLAVGILRVNIEGNGGLYYTEDTDNILTMDNDSTATEANGANTWSIQQIYGYGKYVWMGVSSDHGGAAPILSRRTVTGTEGSLSISGELDLQTSGVDYLGKASGANPGNPNDYSPSGNVVGVESITMYNDTLYIANNGGVVYNLNEVDNGGSGGWDSASRPGDADYKLSVTDTLIDSTNGTMSGMTLFMPDSVDCSSNDVSDGGGLGKVRPGEKGIPILKEYGGKLYMVRNVSIATTISNADDCTAGDATLRDGTENLRGELWVCNPSGGTLATVCEPGDWTRLIAGEETELCNGQSASCTTPESNAISMLEFVGDEVYVGFDDPTNGLRIFHTDATSGIAQTDLAANGGSATDDTLYYAGWQQAGVDRLTTDSSEISSGYNKYIFSSSTITDAYGDDYLFVVVSDEDTAGTQPIRVYRQLGAYQNL